MLTHHALAAAAPFPQQLSQNEDIRFLDLLAAYRVSGGLAPGSEIAARRPSSGLSALGRAIAAGEVIGLQWAGQHWLPVFQFERGDIRVRPPVRMLLAELAELLDEEERIHWFVQPNPWLDNASPLQLLATDFGRVHDAARALRFACNN
ncbi:antitoxin Xre/MbcA/ParS toxin-binding domain-containing protein [Comamonas sp. JUb58]|uniref:antitoxin Xre/MbcA/ParS toxin-binding domain-containing protein n=1 Tax=Comamonas sp. JUb58 TaxID=2485114 RepID=UPI001061C067|nr:antitoxin Xre/MbcA/ParS toxin-binding domain-containing protein [Comamonas sp. JUb58]TDS83708.1 uncharacterized protein DUF2384 [Comamonas sp. JUb58]